MKPIDQRVTRLSSDSIETIESWALPDVAGEHVMAFARKEGGPVQIVEEEQVAEKLTLAELEEIRESARREGFDEGYKDGLEKGLGDGHAKGQVDGHREGYDAGYGEGQAEVTRLQGRLAELIEQQYDPLAVQAENIERQLLDMVISLARAVVGDTAKIDSAVVQQAVAEIVDKIPRPHDDLKIYVHSDDLEAVRDVARQRHERWSVEVDDAIEPGGCRLVGVDSFADNTLAHRFDQVVQQFQSYRDAPDLASSESP